MKKERSFCKNTKLSVVGLENKVKDILPEDRAEERQTSNRHGGPI